MSVRLSCPSCNTAFDLDTIPADRRAACPRCADVFPIRGELAEQATGAPVPLPATRTEPPLHKCKWSLWRVAGIALGLGLLGFIVGLARYYNRGRKPKNEPQPEPANVHALPPAQLSGLGYLPAECNVVFVFQPGPILESATRTKEDPRDVFGQTSIPGVMF